MSGAVQTATAVPLVSSLVEIAWEYAEHGHFFRAAECFEDAAKLMRERGLKRQADEAQTLIAASDLQ